jgi:3-mercaptopyruvate sulfurtransferase SseA
MAGYANPEVLVSTEWVAEHGHDPKVRIVESNEDRALYTQGHVAGAAAVLIRIRVLRPTQRPLYKIRARPVGKALP